MIWWAVSDSNCRNLGFPIFPIGLDKAGWELHRKKIEHAVHIDYYDYYEKLDYTI